MFLTQQFFFFFCISNTYYTVVSTEDLQHFSGDIYDAAMEPLAQEYALSVELKHGKESSVFHFKVISNLTSTLHKCA